MSEILISSSSVLAVVASALLVFVSGGVVYLSVIDWRDRRRRDRATSKRR